VRKIPTNLGRPADRGAPLEISLAQVLERFRRAPLCLSPFSANNPLLAVGVPTNLMEHPVIGRPVLANDDPHQRKILESKILESKILESGGAGLITDLSPEAWPRVAPSWGAAHELTPCRIALFASVCRHNSFRWRRGDAGKSLHVQ
jgi:hypothetical protein